MLNLFKLHHMIFINFDFIDNAVKIKRKGGISIIFPLNYLLIYCDKNKHIFKYVILFNEL